MSALYLLCRRVPMGNLLTTLLLASVVISTQASAQALPLTQLSVPQGFSIEVLSDSVPGARQMALSAQGTLYVGSLQAGKVYAITQALTTPQPARVVLDKLTLPSGIALHAQSLYIGAVSKILKVERVDQQLQDLPADGRLQTLSVSEDLPRERHHGWKYLGFGPDGALYVPVGAPCNICLSEDPRFASILRMNPNTGVSSVYAHGIRNTVGFDWHPQTAELWFTDNGRDLLGDDIPAEELNVAKRAGSHFGYPFVHAGTLLDPELGKDADPADYEPPVLRMQAHSAALGVAFYRGTQFPASYRQALFIAEHGSWNRSSKVGYRISVVRASDTGLRYEPFIEGWLDKEENNWGRPNDVLSASDGSLLISDDQAGAIYRVRYSTPKTD
ncbi:MAG: PQQ-dependent sugar dehydrogenase [Pseudomonadales bacterium]